MENTHRWCEHGNKELWRPQAEVFCVWVAYLEEKGCEGRNSNNIID